MKRASLLITLAATAVTANAAQLTLSAEQQTDLAVTLYKQDLGLIQDSRQHPAISADDTVVIRDVSQQMQTETLQIRGAGKILEQSLNSQLLSYRGLLEQYIGKSLILARLMPGSDTEQRQEVKLMSINESVAVIQNKTVLEAVPLNSKQWRFIFPSRPEGMLLKPSLTFRSEGSKAGVSQLSYLTAGLSWQMDYVATLDNSGRQMSLEGLASLYNQTGSTLKDARVRLLAGQVDQPSQQRQGRMLMAMAKAEMDSGQAPESLGDVKLYSLDNRVTLQNNQHTQVPLLSAPRVAIEQRIKQSIYIHPSIQNEELTLKPQRYIRFANSHQAGLGRPLPGGSVRFFTPDRQNELQFIGGAHLKQSAAGDRLELALGQSFDVGIKMQQTGYQDTFNGSVVSYRLKINNASDQNNTLDLHSQFNQRWELISSTFPVSSTSAGSGRWQIPLAGNSETLFDLQVRLIKTKQ